MTNRIHEAFDTIEASEALKSATMRSINAAREKHSRPIRLPSWKNALAVGCAVLVLLLGIGGYYTTQIPVAYVSIDVNPSVELALNRYDRVVSATAYNKDGEMVLDGIDVKGKLYTEAIDSIVESAVMQPYLTANAALTFTVAAGNDGKENAILDGIERCTGCQRHGGQSYAADVTSLTAAHESGLSLGKYAAYLVLSQYDSSVTAEDCHDMTMAEIRRQISAHESGSEHSEDATVGNGNGHNQGAGNGNGHGDGTGNGHNESATSETGNGDNESVVSVTGSGDSEGAGNGTGGQNSYGAAGNSGKDAGCNDTHKRGGHNGCTDD